MNKINFKLFIENNLKKDEFMKNLSILITKLIENDENWLEEKNISAVKKGNFWVLNYQQTPNKNEFNKLTRGLVVEIPPKGWTGNPLSLIRGFPFIRFFNHKEPQADQVDIGNSEVIEKLDGTFVSVFFLNNDLNQIMFNTRKMLSSDEEDINKSVRAFTGKSYKLLGLIKRYLNNISFNDPGKTYIFEFIEDATKVLTKYSKEQFGLYLIGARNNNSFEEYSEPELDKIAKEINAKRPKRYNTIQNLDIIEKMFKKAAEEQENFEGFIFRDKKTGNRVKVKDPEYVQKHHKISKSVKPILLDVLNGEAEELISYFPMYKELVLSLQKSINNFIENTVSEIKKWKESDLTEKQVAEKLFGRRTLAKWEMRLKNIHLTNPRKDMPNTVKSLILTCIRNKDLDPKEVVVNQLDELKKSNFLDKILELIGFNDNDNDFDIETPET